ncbi:MAG: type II toxin-antitoxin system Phd/YefM family antitoxin [Gammaproteobacteria bacterium]
MNTRTIKASEFKAKCLQLMSEVAETGAIIVVTKNGRPVAQLGPVVSRATTLAGAHRGQITIRGDIVAPVDEAWEAACSSSSIPTR